MTRVADNERNQAPEPSGQWFLWPKSGPPRIVSSRSATPTESAAVPHIQQKSGIRNGLVPMSRASPPRRRHEARGHHGVFGSEVVSAAHRAVGCDGDGPTFRHWWRWKRHRLCRTCTLQAHGGSFEKGSSSGSGGSVGFDRGLGLLPHRTIHGNSPVCCPAYLSRLRRPGIFDIASEVQLPWLSDA